jgi:hypothetical protein
MPRKKRVVMSDSDLLAMYRCFLYTKMGVRNEEAAPRDKQCLDWLQRVMAQAEHRIEPPLFMRSWDIQGAPLPGSMTAIAPIIRRMDIVCGLPDWRA